MVVISIQQILGKFTIMFVALVLSMRDLWVYVFHVKLRIQQRYTGSSSLDKIASTPYIVKKWSRQKEVDTLMKTYHVTFTAHTVG